MPNAIRTSTIFLSLVIFATLITTFAFGQTAYEIDISKGAGFSAYGKCVTTKNCFYPNPLSITTGSTVIWRNTDKVGHFVVSGKSNDNNAESVFDSHGVIRSGNTFQFTFVNAGTYDYHCSAHPWMIGQVIVGSVSNVTTTPIKQKTDVQPTQVKQTCDATLWNHVYHPQRLKVIDPCKTVTGVIQSIKKEADGDYHIQLKLDAQFSNLVNSANVKYQHGYLVLEPVCQNIVTQNDAKSACLNYKSMLTIPPKGNHVTVTGTYVLDLQHDSWAEIHPISSIQIIH
ncbi:MAG: hypothetical protein D4R90_01675 [Nitrosopumilales archaeon]|nr:MAG: hypothetical protein D4R90_01675 [Nitrosopumilales archaeon]